MKSTYCFWAVFVNYFHLSFTFVRYYNLAHAVNERIARQPSMLRAGTLRDYQLVGHYNWNCTF